MSGGCVDDDPRVLATRQYAFSYVPLAPRELRLEMARDGHATGHAGDLLRCEGNVAAPLRDELTSALNVGGVLDLVDDSMPCSNPAVTDAPAYRVCLESDVGNHCADACIDDDPMLRVDRAVAGIVGQFVDAGGCGPEMWPAPG